LSIIGDNRQGNAAQQKTYRRNYYLSGDLHNRSSAVLAIVDKNTAAAFDICHRRTGTAESVDCHLARII
jgi:hypothetical protein